MLGHNSPQGGRRKKNCTWGAMTFDPQMTSQDHTSADVSSHENDAGWAFLITIELVGVVLYCLSFGAIVLDVQ